jgi:pimeloyl-ACP methyl ester carboxylesterase
MLALAYAARYSSISGPLVLIGCGTFDPGSRTELKARLDARMTDLLRSRMSSLREAYPDPDERLRAEGELLLPLYSYDLVEPRLEGGPCDARGAEESWNDMLRLQVEGVYPAAFRSIRVPVLMLHGSDDPHPGRRILEGLRPILPPIEYHEWEQCGHFPWLERATRTEFYETLTGWLRQHANQRAEETG